MTLCLSVDFLIIRDNSRLAPELSVNLANPSTGIVPSIR